MSRLIPKHFPKQSFANLTAAVHPMIQFLTKNHATIDGPGWHIIEAYDGTNRETPSDPTDLDSFSAGFGWRNDVASLGAGDWIVLQSNIGGSNQFQVYFELDSTTGFLVLLMPYADFSTGGPATSPPTFPTRSIGTGASYGSPITLTGFTSTADYTVIADHGVAIFLFDSAATTVYWAYVGELDHPNPSDTRPFVISKNTADVHIDTGTNIWSFSDPFDQTFNHGVWTVWYGVLPGQVHESTIDDDLLGFRAILPVMVHQSTGSLAGIRGWTRHVFSGHEDLGNSGTMDNRRFMYRNDEIGNEASLVFTWDGETDY